MTTQTAIEKAAPQALLTREGLAIQAEQLKLLEDYVANVLRINQDFGVIPGTNGKPTLLKPGAANVAAAFNCHAEPFIDESTLDPVKGFVFYEVHVDLVSNLTGRVMARGFGNCNSYETKYRYRSAMPACPKCAAENIRRSKDGGWYCWAKTGGCGAQFKDTEVKAVGKIVNLDPLELANTLKKMAIKRAEVDAALRLPGVARFFTQDTEDMLPDEQHVPHPTEHWCAEHDIAWEKRTGMKGYAHPIFDDKGIKTDVWCHESASEPGQRAKAERQPTPNAGIPATGAPAAPAVAPTAPSSPATPAQDAAFERGLTAGPWSAAEKDRMRGAWKQLPNGAERIKMLHAMKVEIDQVAAKMKDMEMPFSEPAPQAKKE